MGDEKTIYLNRDLSWLSFNQRVLMEAADKTVPLYNRISFLSIFSSNLDEFFRVRMPSIFAFTSIDAKKLHCVKNIRKTWCSMYKRWFYSIRKSLEIF
jgi:polyphosphate kinase